VYLYGLIASENSPKDVTSSAQRFLKSGIEIKAIDGSAQRQEKG
jgi:hypothetical protein